MFTGLPSDSSKQAEDPEWCKERTPEWAQLFSRTLANPPPVLIAPVKGVDVERAYRKYDELVGGNREESVPGFQVGWLHRHSQRSAAIDAGLRRIGDLVLAVRTDDERHVGLAVP
jgi:hypothetical protein